MKVRWLTARFINQVLCHPRDEDGKLVTEGGDTGGPVDDRELFANVWRGRGASEQQVEALWKAMLEHEAAKERELIAAGIIGMQGEVFDPKQHDDAELVWLEKWRATAKRILGHV